MLPPLQALLLMREASSPATPGGKSLAARQPAPSRDASPGPRWKTRGDVRGTARRVYLPQAAGLVGSWGDRALQLLQQVPSVQSGEAPVTQPERSSSANANEEPRDRRHRMAIPPAA